MRRLKLHIDKSCSIHGREFPAGKFAEVELADGITVETFVHAVLNRHLIRIEDVATQATEPDATTPTKPTK